MKSELSEKQSLKYSSAADPCDSAAERIDLDLRKSMNKDAASMLCFALRRTVLFRMPVNPVPSKSEQNQTDYNGSYKTAILRLSL